MKNVPRIKSTLLLTIFLSYTVLSCVPQNQNDDLKVNSVSNTIKRIQDRLSNKDFNSEKPFDNPHKDIKKELAKVMQYLHQNTVLKDKRGFKKVNLGNQKSNFRLVSSSIDETLTFGIDDPENFERIVTEATNYYNGAYSRDEISVYYSSLNNTLVNYPMTYSGGSQFLMDRVADGTLSQSQRLIIEAELNALLNATSESEVLNILNVVNQELSLSQLPAGEINQIFDINAGIEGVIEFEEQIAHINGHTDIFHKTGSAGLIIGAALLAVGLIIMRVGDYSVGETLGQWGAVILAATFVLAWGEQ